MKTKLIQIKDYLLLIDEEAEKTGYILAKDTNIVFQDLSEGDKRGIKQFPQLYEKIIAYYPLNSEAKELDLPLLPKPFEEVDIEKLMFDAIQKARGNDFNTFYKLAAKNCTEVAAQLSNKQFSLEDMQKAIEMAQQESWDEGGYLGLEYKPKQIIQSLSTQQLPSEFIPEYIGGGEYLAGEIGGNEIWAEYPKKLKTITNSESKKELVGTYRY